MFGSGIDVDHGLPGVSVPPPRDRAELNPHCAEGTFYGCVLSRLATQLVHDRLFGGETYSD